MPCDGAIFRLGVRLALFVGFGGSEKGLFMQIVADVTEDLMRPFLVVAVVEEEQHDEGQEDGGEFGRHTRQDVEEVEHCDEEADEGNCQHQTI